MKDERTKTVALYARVSTLDQNCDLQLADLRRYASQRFTPPTNTSTMASVEPSAVARRWTTSGRMPEADV